LVLTMNSATTLMASHNAEGHNATDPLGGCFGLTKVESESMMGFWAMAASPMLMSNDLPTIAPWAKAILLNRDVIARCFFLRQKSFPCYLRIAIQVMG
jgi:hypothetical protein